MSRNLFATFAAVLVCCVAGCGDEFGKPVAVTGKVTIGGKPVEKGRIIFSANDKKLPGELRNVATELKPDGTYLLDKVYVAEYTVMLESTEAVDATKSAVPTVNPLTPYGPGSMLRAKVAADQTKFDFDLPASASGQSGGAAK